MGDACENESDEVKWGRWLLNCNASLLLISSRSDSLVILIDRESLSSKTWEREREREFVLSCFVSTICLRFTSFVGGGGGGGQGASRALVTFNCTLQRQLALCAYIQSLSIGCRMLSHYISTYCTLTHFWLNEKIEQLILNDLTDVATVVVAISCVNVFIYLSLSLYCDSYCDSNSFSFILSNPSTWNETKRCDYSRTSLEMEDVSKWAREKKTGFIGANSVSLSTPTVRRASCDAAAAAADDDEDDGSTQTRTVVMRCRAGGMGKWLYTESKMIYTAWLLSLDRIDMARKEPSFTCCTLCTVLCLMCSDEARNWGENKSNNKSQVKFERRI